MSLFKILSICKGGGYHYCRTDPPHPKRNKSGLYPLHRVLMENHIGRILDKKEHVHHINHNKMDDSIENLQVLSASEHSKLHSKKRQIVTLTCFCGKIFNVPNNDYKQRIYRKKLKNNTNPITCSVKCARQQTQRLKFDLGEFEGNTQ